MLVLLLFLSLTTTHRTIPALQPSEWHRASTEECYGEYTRELVFMQLNGKEQEDPPISMSVRKATLKTITLFDPCGFTDGKTFRPVCVRFFNDTQKLEEFNCDEF